MTTATLEPVPITWGRTPREFLVETYPAEQVAVRSPDEVDPREVGLTRSDVDAIWGAVTRYYQVGLHPAIALCIRKGGKIILNRTIGHARGNEPGSPRGPLKLATPNTLFNFFSGSKSITAMLIHLLEERGQLSVNDPVAAYIPEFARFGKSRVSIHDVLCHRAGIPSAPGTTFNLDLIAEPQEIISRICDLKPAPHRQLAYHAITGGFILGEIIRRVSGDDIRTFLDKNVRKPLGFDALGYGVPRDRLSDVAQDTLTGPMPGFPFAQLMRRSLGVTFQEAIGLATDPRFLTGVVPSGNIIGSANEICRFFELLLRGGSLDGVRIFRPETVRRAVAKQTTGEIDKVIMLPVPYSMGFMLGAETVGFYGVRAPQAFGHLGFTNVLAWADPERDISAALMNNGKPFITLKLLRWLNIMRIISSRIRPTAG